MDITFRMPIPLNLHWTELNWTEPIDRSIQRFNPPNNSPRQHQKQNRFVVAFPYVQTLQINIKGWKTYSNRNSGEFERKIVYWEKDGKPIEFNIIATTIVVVNRLSIDAIACLCHPYFI